MTPASAYNDTAPDTPVTRRHGPAKDVTARCRRGIDMAFEKGGRQDSRPDDTL